MEIDIRKYQGSDKCLPGNNIVYSDATMDGIALIDLKKVKALTGTSSAWIWAAVRDGRFVQPVMRQTRCTRWLLADVRQWILDLAKTQASTRARAARG